jgi:hypothetical protein
VSPVAHSDTYDIYAMHGRPQLDIRTRQLTWGRLLKYGASTDYQFVDVGCVEAVLYVVFCDRPVKDSNPSAVEQFQMRTYMMQVRSRCCVLHVQRRWFE